MIQSRTNKYNSTFCKNRHDTNGCHEVRSVKNDTKNNTMDKMMKMLGMGVANMADDDFIDELDPDDVAIMDAIGNMMDFSFIFVFSLCAN